MELDQLAAALVAFQGDMPAIGKDKTANIPLKGGGKYSYSYADLSTIWDALRPKLKAHGLAVTQELQGGSNGYTGIKTTVWHASGQYTCQVVEVATQGKSPQEIGSAITYFKRYALSAALGISTEEDDDGQAASKADVVHVVKSPLELAKADLRVAIQKSGADPNDYTWVAEATEANVDEIRGVIEALNLGKVVAQV